LDQAASEDGADKGQAAATAIAASEAAALRGCGFFMRGEWS